MSAEFKGKFKKKDKNTIEGSSQIQRETGREVFAVFVIPQALVYHLESLL